MVPALVVSERTKHKAYDANTRIFVNFVNQNIKHSGILVILRLVILRFFQTDTTIIETPLFLCLFLEEKK